MRLLDLFLFLAIFFILSGTYQFYFLYLSKKLFSYQKEKGYDKSWFQFCCEKFDSLVWKLRNQKKFRLFYETKLFPIFLRLKGIILVVLGISILIMILTVYNSDYRQFLLEKL